MTRFIIISFAFLAFAFYELSGGSDFDAEATRLARVDAPVEVTEQTLEREVADASVATPVSEESVTRVKLNLETTSDVLRPAPTLRTKPAVTRVAATADDANIAADTAVSEEEPTIILPSLLVDRPVITPVDFNDDGAAQTAILTSTGAVETRRVTGNRVNVRGGPGTDYSVVGSLTKGDRVEILQNPGNGWVQMRAANGGTVGWMADFLLGEG